VIYLFDKNTNELRYAELVKPFFLVLEIQNGLVERKFTDEDFRKVLTKCPQHSNGADFEVPEILESFGLF